MCDARVPRRRPVNRSVELRVLLLSEKEGAMTSNRYSRIIRLLVTALVLTGTTAVAAASTSDATTSATTNCSVTWGSLPKADGAVAYVPEVYTEGRGDVVALRGGAKLHIVVRGDVAGVRTGRHECYDRLVVDLAPNAYVNARPGQ